MDGGRDLAMKQRGFQLINPSEKWFPGMNQLLSTFSSWDWRFGKTPKFSVQKRIQLNTGDKGHDVRINVDVEGGVIQDITLMLPNSEPIPVVSNLKETPYNEDSFNGIISAIRGVSTENVKHAMGL